MLYLGVTLQARGASFDAPLTPAAQGHRKTLASVFTTLGIASIYACPTLRALRTVQPYVTGRRAASGVVSLVAEYRLYPWVTSHAAVPRRLQPEELRPYGLTKYAVDGWMPREREPHDEFRERVLEWLNRTLMPAYLESPVPTLVLADAEVVALLITALCGAISTLDDDYIDPATVHGKIKPGAVFEFGSAGFTPKFNRQV